MFSRVLTAEDLGLAGHIVQLQGTISLVGDVLIVSVEMIEGQITNPFSVIPYLIQEAQNQGARVLQIQATFANERLLEVMSRRYSIVSSGSQDVLTIVVRE